DAARRAEWAIVASERLVTTAYYVLGAVAYLSCVVSVILHHRPNANRTTKYTFLMIGIGLLWTLFLLLNPRWFPPWIIDQDPHPAERPDQPSFILFMFLMGPALYLLVGLLALRT